MVLREFRKRFRRKRPALFKSGQWHFYLDNTPVHNSIFVTDYLSKMGIRTVPQPPYSPDLATCDFWLFPKLRGCRYETIEKMKEAVTKVIDTHTHTHTHKRTSMEPSRSCWNGTTSALEPEIMCTINKTVHTEKSGNIFNDPRIYIYIYIYIYSLTPISHMDDFKMVRRCKDLLKNRKTFLTNYIQEKKS